MKNKSACEYMLICFFIETCMFVNDLSHINPYIYFFNFFNSFKWYVNNKKISSREFNPLSEFIWSSEWHLTSLYVDTPTDNLVIVSKAAIENLNLP